MGKGMIFLIVILILIIITIVQFIREKNDDIQKNNSIDDVKLVSYGGRFYMKIIDVFTIYSRGMVVTGKIESGSVKVGDKVEVVLDDNRKIQTTVMAVEMLRKVVKDASVGDNVGILLSEIKKENNVKYIALKSIE
jgi:translation elongation factor Tu